MLSPPDMIAHGVPDAPPAPIPLRCAGCAHLVTRHHQDHVPSTGTSARCAAGRDGKRLIGWEWQPTDRAPHWCPKRSAGQ